MALEMGARYKSDWDSSCTHLVWVAQIIAMFERGNRSFYVNNICLQINHLDSPWVPQSLQWLFLIYVQALVLLFATALIPTQSVLNGFFSFVHQEYCNWSMMLRCAFIYYHCLWCPMKRLRLNYAFA
jgi:hypothetical protein